MISEFVKEYKTFILILPLYIRPMYKFVVKEVRMSEALALEKLNLKQRAKKR